MKLLTSLLFASLSAGTALAACPDDMASAGSPDPTVTAAIAKDGTRAPMEGTAQPGAQGFNLAEEEDGNRFPAASEDVAARQGGEQATQPGAADRADTSNLIAKDGSTMPLAEQYGGGDRDIAMSQQDAEAQQEGEETAAAAADGAIPLQPGAADRTDGDNLIAKDGSRAPLEGGAEPGSAGRPDDGNLIAKDGSTMPLAEQPGGGDRDVAMSQQDAEAQQEGKKTAAAAALDDDCE